MPPRSLVPMVVFSLHLVVACAAPPNEGSEISAETVQLEWSTEPMESLSPNDAAEGHFGAMDSRVTERTGRKNHRISALRIAAFGKPIMVFGWMYLDLANPYPETYRAYGNRDGISLEFRVGSEGAAWDVTYRLVPQSTGYRVMERSVCDAELKPDVCVVTHNSTWFYD